MEPLAVSRKPMALPDAPVYESYGPTEAGSMAIRYLRRRRQIRPYSNHSRENHPRIPRENSMKKSHSHRPTRATDPIEILNQVKRTLEEGALPAIAELRAAIEERRRREQLDTLPARGRKKLAAPRSRKSSPKARRARRP